MASKTCTCHKTGWYAWIENQQHWHRSFAVAIKKVIYAQRYDQSAEASCVKHGQRNCPWCQLRYP
jgi:hypothetical protein